jgi:hypothetical protein
VDVKDLEVRVSKAKEKVEKCQKTIERHEKQLEKKIQAVIKAVDLDLTGKNKNEIDELREPYRNTEHSWTIYEVIGKLDDIKGATRKLKDAEIVLENWREKLHAELEKENYIQNNIPQVIKDFLEEWKEKCFYWYVDKYDAYRKLSKELKDDKEKTILEYIKTAPEYAEHVDENGNIDYDFRLQDSYHSKELQLHLKECELHWTDIEKRKKGFLAMAGWVVVEMCRYYDETERLAFLEKTLEKDKKAKMLDLIFRINEVVGTITDASRLRISEKGNLDGIIEGEKGKAKIETIGAGGFNIQVFHYRTLVHKI